MAINGENVKFGLTMDPDLFSGLDYLYCLEANPNKKKLVILPWYLYRCWLTQGHMHHKKFKRSFLSRTTF
jgi:hypothetical protein